MGVEESGVSRAGQAVKLLTRIRQERPELWKQIQEFARCACESARDVPPVEATKAVSQSLLAEGAKNRNVLAVDRS